MTCLQGVRCFATSNLALAAFLVAGKHLQLEKIGINDSGIAEFIFRDPDGTGPRLEADYVQDAVVPATQFHRQLRTLRRLIDEKSSREFNTNTRIKAYEHARRW